MEYSNTLHSDGEYENFSGSFSRYTLNVVDPTPPRILNSLLYLLLSKIILE